MCFFKKIINLKEVTVTPSLSILLPVCTKYVNGNGFPLKSDRTEKKLVDTVFDKQEMISNL